MASSSERVLVTGATGQIGSELIFDLRKRFGKDNVVAAGHSKAPTEALQNSGPFEYLDTSDKSAIQKTVDQYGIDCIYHLAGILSAVGEKNPQLAWKVNMDSLRNVLEIARENKFDKYFGLVRSLYSVRKLHG